MLGARQVANHDPRGVGLPAGRPQRNQPDAMAPAVQHDRGLGRQIIDGVDHQIDRPGEGGRHIVFGHEIIDAFDDDARIDQPDPRRHGLHLGLAERIFKRVDLAVDVGFGHMVEIDQAQMPHTTARQRLDHPRAHPANARHHHARLQQARQRGPAIQARHTAKTALTID